MRAGLLLSGDPPAELFLASEPQSPHVAPSGVVGGDAPTGFSVVESSADELPFLADGATSGFSFFPHNRWCTRRLWHPSTVLT